MNEREPLSFSRYLGFRDQRLPEEPPKIIVVEKPYTAGEMGKAISFARMLRAANEYGHKVKRGEMRFMGESKGDASVLVTPHVVSAINTMAFHQYEEYAEKDPHMKVLFDAVLNNEKKREQALTPTTDELNEIWDKKF